MFYDAPQATLIYDSLSETPVYAPKKLENEIPSCRYLYLGNYVRGKGQNLALKAFSRVAGQLTGAAIHFAGWGEAGELDKQYIDELIEFVVKEGLSDRVYFEGPVKDVEKTMKDADVVVNLSESESFSMVCLEALTYGMPLIVSDCGGPRELVQNDVNGLLVGNRNVDQAAAADVAYGDRAGLGSSIGG